MWLQQQRCHKPLARIAATPTPRAIRPLAHLHTVHKPARRVDARVFDNLRNFVNKVTSSSSNSSSNRDSSSEQYAEEEGAEMVRIDTESSGGLGGTSEEVFGPLVGVSAVLSNHV